MKKLERPLTSQPLVGKVTGDFSTLFESSNIAYLVGAHGRGSRYVVCYVLLKIDILFMKWQSYAFSDFSMIKKAQAKTKTKFCCYHFL